MAKRRANVLALSDLGKAVDKAVALAAKRHEVKPEAGTFIKNWEIVGRILRNLDNLNDAFSFAREVTRAAKVKGLKAEPAVLKVGPDVLCGFIERGQLLRQIGR